MLLRKRDNLIIVTGSAQKIGVNNTMLVPGYPAEAEYILHIKRARTRRSGKEA